MSNLPNLDTSNVSYIAYWNAIDQGGVASADMNPEECLNDGSIGSYSLYDNGIQGEYTLPNGRLANFRVKSDGWFLVWLNRQNNFTQGTTNVDDCRGVWDILEDWYSGSGPAQIQTNELSTSIQSLHSNLDQSGAFEHSAVGLYNYEFTAATTATLLSAGRDAGLGTFGLSYTSGTNIYQHHVVAHGEEDGNANGYWGFAVEFEGVGVNMPLANYEQQTYGSIDVLSRSLTPNANTEYTGTNDANGYDSARTGCYTHLTIWS